MPSGLGFGDGVHLRHTLWRRLGLGLGRGRGLGLGLHRARDQRRTLCRGRFRDGHRGFGRRWACLQLHDGTFGDKRRCVRSRHSPCRRRGDDGLMNRGRPGPLDRRRSVRPPFGDRGSRCRGHGRHRGSSGYKYWGHGRRGRGCRCRCRLHQARGEDDLDVGRPHASRIPRLARARHPESHFAEAQHEYQPMHQQRDHQCIGQVDA